MDGTEIGEVLGVGESEVVEKVATGGGKTVEQRVHSTFWGGSDANPQMTQRPTALTPCARWMGDSLANSRSALTSFLK